MIIITRTHLKNKTRDRPSRSQGCTGGGDLEGLILIILRWVLEEEY